ncbi:hypothetical protein Q1695_004727 [Nippostrongylus brasiliensis]|nr:hypothetical protein Q1695_004727 [Nippostrongylus brasiliensis]
MPANEQTADRSPVVADWATLRDPYGSILERSQNASPSWAPGGGDRRRAEVGRLAVVVSASIRVERWWWWPNLTMSTQSSENNPSRRFAGELHRGSAPEMASPSPPALLDIS